MIAPKLRALAVTVPLAMSLTSPSLAMEPLEMLPDGMARARMGDVELYHDPAKWRIDGDSNDFVVWCRGVECDEPVMTVSLLPRDQSVCTPGAVVDRTVLAHPDAWTRKVMVASAIGLTVHVATIDQGCRNWAGSPVYACTEHKGRIYWFVAAGDHCHTSVGYTEAMVALLNGLSSAELADQ